MAILNEIGRFWEGYGARGQGGLVNRMGSSRSTHCLHGLMSAWASTKECLQVGSVWEQGGAVHKKGDRQVVASEGVKLGVCVEGLASGALQRCCFRHWSKCWRRLKAGVQGWCSECRTARGRTQRVCRRTSRAGSTLWYTRAPLQDSTQRLRSPAAQHGAMHL